MKHTYIQVDIRLLSHVSVTSRLYYQRVCVDSVSPPGPSSPGVPGGPPCCPSHLPASLTHTHTHTLFIFTGSLVFFTRLCFQSDLLAEETAHTPSSCPSMFSTRRPNKNAIMFVPLFIYFKNLSEGINKGMKKSFENTFAKYIKRGILLCAKCKPHVDDFFIEDILNGERWYWNSAEAWSRDTMWTMIPSHTHTHTHTHTRFLLVHQWASPCILGDLGALGEARETDFSCLLHPSFALKIRDEEEEENSS